jgi:hypothetical protein
MLSLVEIAKEDEFPIVEQWCSTLFASVAALFRIYLLKRIV